MFLYRRRCAECCTSLLYFFSKLIPSMLFAACSLVGEPVRKTASGVERGGPLLSRALSDNCSLWKGTA